MHHASYTSNQDIYDIELIVNSDSIDADMESVKDTIADTDPIIYRKNMVESVRQGLAYDIWKNGTRVGFVDNRIDGHRYLGCSINIWDNIGMVLAMKTMFEICDKHKIEFVPHESNLKYFKSMLLGASIRGWHQGERDAVVVMRDDVETKGLKMFKYLGLGVV